VTDDGSDIHILTNTTASHASVDRGSHALAALVSVVVGATLSKHVRNHTPPLVEAARPRRLS